MSIAQRGRFSSKCKWVGRVRVVVHLPQVRCDLQLICAQLIYKYQGFL